MIDLLREFRRAGRTLARSPGFALACVVTLAIGVGATTTVFSLVDAILLEPLPYRDADRLVAVSHTAPGIGLDAAGMSEGAFMHYRDRSRSLEAIATYFENNINLTGGDADAERVPVAMVSLQFFEVLGARTVVGRLPGEEEADTAGVVPVLMSYDLWQRRYGGDPAIVGSTIEANRGPRRVIGVMERGFGFPRRETDLWYPFDPDPATARAADLYQGSIARLAPGVSPDAAERELNGLIASLPESYPDLSERTLAESRLRAIVRPLEETVTGDARAALWLLLGGMAFLLLIACANVANLFLVRVEHREKEIALRTALGASRVDLAQFFAAESVIVSALGGALATFLADAGVRALVAYGPRTLPRLHEVRVDAGVIGLVVLLSFLTALLFAVVPLFRHRSGALTTSLAEGSFGATANVNRRRVRSLLVGAQVALALTLLIGSALMTQSFWRLGRADPGFDADDVLTAEIAMSFRGYDTYDRVHALWRDLIERVRALPGVLEAGTVTGVPLVPKPLYYDMALDIESRPDEARAAVTIYHVTPGYFGAMQIPVIEGQSLEQAGSSVERPVLLSAAAARRLFPGESALGRRIRRASRANNHPWTTVVGIVGDVPKQSIGGESAEVVYMPIGELATDPGLFPASGTLVVRTSVPPTSLAAAIRQIVRELDPNLPLASVRTMDSIVAGSIARTSFTMLLLIIAAAAALFLGSVGLYGVISYTVSRRTHEIGIRVALGARGSDMRGMLVREGARIVTGGIIAGIAASLVLTRFLRALLFEVSPNDPVSFGATILVLCSAALLATWVPAQRASRIEPAEALRMN
jgi:predicted permease